MRRHTTLEKQTNSGLDRIIIELRPATNRPFLGIPRLNGTVTYRRPGKPPSSATMFLLFALREYRQAVRDFERDGYTIVEASG